jgi:hypothetical protein
VLVAVAANVTEPPVTQPDTFRTNWATPVVCTPLDNDVDPESGDLSLVRLHTAGLQGIAFVDSGATTVTYLPPAGFQGPDTFTYIATDCEGGNAPGDIVVLVSSISPVPGSGNPCAYRLHPCIPNPFNPVTRLRFDLPTAGPVELAVFDLRGRRVATLVREWLGAGVHVRDWWGRDDRGRALASGVYFARLQAGGRSEVTKMMLVR